MLELLCSLLYAVEDHILVENHWSKFSDSQTSLVRSELCDISNTMAKVIVTSVVVETMTLKGAE